MNSAIRFYIDVWGLRRISQIGLKTPCLEEILRWITARRGGTLIPSPPKQLSGLGCMSGTQ